ncbi:structural protein fragment [Periplaneta fuliginosa densovirus]|uniref:structural protein fragment n=1 Tax=Periplaneta fuliginosa densovirus TaxID=97344 RepID=UPI00001637DE|nr:structural protein fragment [Periplaneta fuliginosa densovirus]
MCPVVVVVVVVGYSEAMAKHQGEGVTEGGGGSEDIKERAQSGSVSRQNNINKCTSTNTRGVQDIIESIRGVQRIIKSIRGVQSW